MKEHLIRNKDISRGQHVYAANYHVMIEPVYGCNRRCSFCACDFSQFHLMEEEVFAKVLENIDHNTKRMTWNLCGEPTLHPKLIEMVSRAKAKAPKAAFIMITNGDVKVTQKKSFAYFEELAVAGMDLIHYDIYDPEDEPIVQTMVDTYKGKTLDIVYFGNGSGSFWGQNNKKPMVVVMPASFNINRVKTTNTKFNTQAGCTPLETWAENGVDGALFPLRKTCKEVLKYAVVCWDGAYALCCADHGRPTDYGNILTMSIPEFWVSEKKRMTQLALSCGRRDLVPSCYYCDKLSFRDGLYPYPYVESFTAEEMRMLYEDSHLKGKMLANFHKIDEAFPIKSAAMRKLYNKSKGE